MNNNLKFSIYPIKKIKISSEVVKPNYFKTVVLKSSDEYTNIYKKYKNFIDKALNVTKITNTDFYKVNIYKGELFLQNDINKVISLKKDKEIFLFFNFLAHLNDNVFVHKKEIDFSRLDRLLFEWDLRKFSLDVISINKRIEQIGNNISEYKNLEKKKLLLNIKY
jgi:hypothetical protein